MKKDRYGDQFYKFKRTVGSFFPYQLKITNVIKMEYNMEARIARKSDYSPAAVPCVQEKTKVSQDIEW